MGQVQTEQAIEIIEATIRATEASQPEPTNYLWLLILATIPIIPVMISMWRKKNGKKNKK